MSIQTKTMKVKSDTSIAETSTTIMDTVTFDVSKMPNGITYKGLKAVLSFADPIQWNGASTYDSLTVVWDDATHASYASKRPVPQNIELTNEFYWLRTADLDAQVEMYRQEVMEFDGRITANAQAIAAETARAEGAEQTLQENIAAETARAEAAEKKIAFSEPILVAIGDSWVNPTTAWYKQYAWPKTAASLLGCTAYKNLSVEGAGGGFTNLSTNASDRYVSFNAQVQYAEDTFTDFEKANTKYVVVIGGTNDFGYGNITITSWTSNVQTVLSHAAKVFPNAKILHLIDNSLCSNNPTGDGEQHNAERWNKLKSFIPDIFNTYLPYSKFDLIPSMLSGKYYRDDWLHPSKEGCAMIAYLVSALLNGNKISFNRNPSFIGSYEEKETDDNLKASISANHDGTVTITFNSLTINSNTYTSIVPNVKLKTILGYINPLNLPTYTAYLNNRTIAVNCRIDTDSINVRNIDPVDTGEKTVKLIMNFRIG